VIPEPAAIAFANTRSSVPRDRIATLVEWRAWIDTWPALRSAGHRVDAAGLTGLRRVRDDVQSLLRSAASGDRHDRATARRVIELARSGPELGWRGGRPVLLPGADPSAAIAQHFARATVEVLLTGPPVAVCEGLGCLKIFVAARPDRRWCDSSVCGNRARVRNFDRRRHGAARSTRA
jgi:predicted RNA-binding Zn ribbon-like protein